jgi:transposase, IS6 family
MILSAIAKRLKRRSKDDFKGRHFEAPLILQAVCWYLRYPLSYRDIEELFVERGRRDTAPSARGHGWGRHCH